MYIGILKKCVFSVNVGTWNVQTFRPKKQSVFRVKTVQNVHESSNFLISKANECQVGFT